MDGRCRRAWSFMFVHPFPRASDTQEARKLLAMAHRTFQAVTGYFTAMGDSQKPFDYKITKVRTGRSYAVRSVTVEQPGRKGVCFVCTASFKKPDRAAPGERAVLPAMPDFGEALGGIPHEEQPDYLSTDEVLYVFVALWSVVHGTDEATASTRCRPRSRKTRLCSSRAW